VTVAIMQATCPGSGDFTPSAAGWTNHVTRVRLASQIAAGKPSSRTRDLAGELVRIDPLATPTRTPRSAKAAAAMKVPILIGA